MGVIISTDERDRSCKPIPFVPRYYPISTNSFRVIKLLDNVKIVDACRIIGRGHALITDEAFTPSGLAHARTTKKIRVASAERVVELDIAGVEAVLKTGGNESLGFLVPFIEDESIRAFILNRDIELVSEESQTCRWTE